MPDDERHPADDERVITATELGKLLRISSSTVRRRCKDDGWPHLRMKWKGTSRIVFTRSDVALILESMRPAPVIELRRERKRTPAPAPTRKRRSS